MSETNEMNKTTGVGRLGTCKWYTPHKWSEWIDITKDRNSQGHPVLVQERRCKTCNKAQRSIVLCNS